MNIVTNPTLLRTITDAHQHQLGGHAERVAVVMAGDRAAEPEPYALAVHEQQRRLVIASLLLVAGADKPTRRR